MTINELFCYLIANLNAVLYDFRILSFLWMYKLMTYNMKIEMLLI